MRLTNVNSFKKEEKKISRGSFNQYSKLFNMLTEGVCIIDEYGYIEYINKAYEDIFRINKYSVIGESIFRIQNDDLVLTAFREKRDVKGVLNYRIGINCIESSASLIYDEKTFKGILALYRKKSITDKNLVNLPLEINVETENDEIIENNSFDKIIGSSNVMQEVFSISKKACKTSSTVLITGESGTGKELLARAIHNNSNRKEKEFVAVNCGAIPHNLIESELFGHEEGSFTGAIKDKIGKFERSSGGTIFLDEIGDLPLNMQVKLLRVIQEREVERVGGNETIKVDTRIIAATNKNLKNMVEEDKFREDLYYRLNVIPIYLPSLKERRADIPLLIKHFVGKISRKLSIGTIKITKEAMNCFCSYNWPGNVRELENIIERLLVLTDTNEISINDLPKNISNVYDVNMKKNETMLINLNKNGKLATLKEYEKEIIKFAIDRFGSFNAAGKALGITHKTVAFKARKYGIVD